MALVWEKLESEEDIAYFHSFGFKSMVAPCALMQPLHWGVDRERDIRVIMMDGQGWKHSSRGGVPMFVGIIWKGKVILIETWYEAKGDTRTPGQAEYWWQIERVRVPLSLAVSKDQVIERVPSPLREEVLDLVRESMIMVAIKANSAKSADFDYIKEPYFYHE